ncbi:MAG: YhbY family RNA-binding protein [Pseudazoarcus pumilus]|nr:YhbY family RNA-binding protein [Pseudazoarcus pumilus]
MIELTPAQRREFRAAAHHLNPVVTIAGNGLTPAVMGEIDRSLQAHELIKIKVQGAERDARDALMLDLCAQLEAAPVQHIGNILIVWRQRREETVSKTAAKAEPRGNKRPSVAKSARAFAANARRTALMQAAAEKKRLAARRSPRKPG